MTDTHLRLDDALRALKRDSDTLETTKLDEYVYDKESSDAFADARERAEDAFVDYCKERYGLDLGVTFFWVGP